MIKVSVVSTENGDMDMLEDAMGLGSQGITHIVGSYEGGYVVASEGFLISDDGDSINDIVSMVEHSSEGVIEIYTANGNLIEVEVIV